MRYAVVRFLPSPRLLRAGLPACLLAAMLLVLAPPAARPQTPGANGGDGYTTSVHVYISAVTYRYSLICAKLGVEVPEPEFVAGVRADPAVYVKGSTMTLDVDLSTTPDDGPYTSRRIDWQTPNGGDPFGLVWAVPWYQSTWQASSPKRHPPYDGFVPSAL